MMTEKVQKISCKGVCKRSSSMQAWNKDASVEVETSKPRLQLSYHSKCVLTKWFDLHERHPYPSQVTINN